SAESFGDVRLDGAPEAGRIVRQADPGVAEPLLQVDLHQPVFGAVYVLHASQVRRRHQLAVQLVGPGMVRALQRPPYLPGGVGTQPRTTVAAHIEECAQRTVPAADHDHALPAYVRRPERAR